VSDQNLNPKKVLVMHFGQVGDVIMGFPALAAIRSRFSDAKMTVIGGKTPIGLIRDLALADEVIAVDRQALLESRKPRAVADIFRIVRDVRRRKFDMVVDLHSLYETNLLGYLSGARTRLFASRRNRSLDLLSNFEPQPPEYDATKHLSEIYLDVLRPLGIDNVDRNIVIKPPNDLVTGLREKFSIEKGNGKRIGLAVGAGHPSRRWSLTKFAELAAKLDDRDDQLFVFLGPEEKSEKEAITRAFGGTARIIPDLSLIELAAAFSSIDILIGNDTGTTHLAAVTAPAVVMVGDKRAPETYKPLGQNTTVVNSGTIEHISTNEVFSAVQRALSHH
jgi:ADP-heptose:LPS heptosyltransferase